MSTKYELTAEPRSAKGTGASRRLRRSGKVPAVLYGAGKPPLTVALDHNLMARHLANEKFHTSILTVNVNGETDQAILRDFHMHPFKPIVMHVDLQRISATEKIHMEVPIHFVGGDVAPGVKLEGGVVTHLMNEIDVTCLPKDLPEFLTVDLSNLNLNESVHLKDIKLPEGVTISSLAHGGDNLAVAAISIIKVVEEAPVVAAPVEGEAAVAAPAEGEAKPGEAKPGEAKPAEAKSGEAKKGEAPKGEAKKPEAKKPEGKKPEGKKEGK